MRENQQIVILPAQPGFNVCHQMCGELVRTPVIAWRIVTWLEGGKAFGYHSPIGGDCEPDDDDDLEWALENPGGTFTASSGGTFPDEASLVECWREEAKRGQPPKPKRISDKRFARQVGIKLE